MDNNQNIPAFPIQIGCNVAFGLTKLEYFTAMAMQGILANDNNIETNILESKSIYYATNILRTLGQKSNNQ